MSECEDCGVVLYRDDLKLCPRCRDERDQAVEPQPHTHPSGWAGWRDYYEGETDGTEDDDL